MITLHALSFVLHLMVSNYWGPHCRSDAYKGDAYRGHTYKGDVSLNHICLYKYKIISILSGCLPDLENLENLEIRLGDLENLEYLSFSKEKPWKPWN